MLLYNGLKVSYKAILQAIGCRPFIGDMAGHATAPRPSPGFHPKPSGGVLVRAGRLRRAHVDLSRSESLDEQLLSTLFDPLWPLRASEAKERDHLDGSRLKSLAQKR